jgi:hypothetical protein
MLPLVTTLWKDLEPSSKTEQLEHDPPPTMPYNQHYTTPQNASVYGAQLYVIATTLCNCR